MRKLLIKINFPLIKENKNLIKKYGIKLDYTYVVPYNVNLLIKYQAYVNGEWCDSLRSIKYLFKYIFKESSQVIFVLNEDIKMNKYVTVKTTTRVDN